MKLHQLLALIKGEKPRAERAFTAMHHAFQRMEPLTGISRVYQPRDEEGEQLPAESQRVQTRAGDLVDSLRTDLGRLFNLTLTHEVGNQHANADVIVDGRVILAKVPVTYLLFLEKKLVDFQTVVNKLPVLDPATAWHYDENTGTYRSTPAQTVRSKKVPRNHVVSPATDKHPAQVQVWQEDVPVGIWTTVRFSGALPADRIAELRTRVQKLQDAVRVARETANSTEVTMQDAQPVLDYLFT